MRHIVLCHDPPSAVQLATISVYFGRQHRHGRIQRHLQQLCQKLNIWIEHVVRAPKTLVFHVANASREQLEQLCHHHRPDIVVTVEM